MPVIPDPRQIGDARGTGVRTVRFHPRFQQTALSYFAKSGATVGWGRVSMGWGPGMGLGVSAPCARLLLLLLLSTSSLSLSFSVTPVREGGPARGGRVGPGGRAGRGTGRGSSCSRCCLTSHQNYMVLYSISHQDYMYNKCSYFRMLHFEPLFSNFET